jgi:hypothetical protein
MRVTQPRARTKKTRASALRVGLGSVLDVTGISTYHALQRTLPPTRRRPATLGDSYQRFAKSAQAALKG